MRQRASVPGYLDETIQLELHDGAIQIVQSHELMGDTKDSIYLEPEQVPALVTALNELHAAEIAYLAATVPSYTEDAGQ